MVTKRVHKQGPLTEVYLRFNQDEINTLLRALRALPKETPALVSSRASLIDARKR